MLIVRRVFRVAARFPSTTKNGGKLELLRSFASTRTSTSTSTSTYNKAICNNKDSSSKSQNDMNVGTPQADHKLIQPQILLPNPAFHNKSAIKSIASEMHSKGFATTEHVSSGPILSPAICQILKEEVIPNLFRGNFDTGIYPDEWHWREGISRNDAAREMCNSWKSSRKIASIVLHEQLGNFIAEVMGWESVGVRLAQDDIVWKPPQSLSEESHRLKDGDEQNGNEIETSTRRRIDTVGFHQDSAYISTQFEPYENNSVTVWMALDDADEENGCLEYAVGSHHWRPILHNLVSEGKKCTDDIQDDGNSHSDINISSFHGSDDSSYRNGLHDAAIAAGFGEHNMENIFSTIESVPVRMGHAVLHHQDVWHGSGPNLSSTRHRRALVAHYIRGDVKFADDQGVDDQPFGKSSYIYGRYKRYRSNVVDETFFPIVYGVRGTCEGAEKRLIRTSWINRFVAS